MTTASLQATGRRRRMPRRRRRHCWPHGRHRALRRADRTVGGLHRGRSRAPSPDSSGPTAPGSRRCSACSRACSVPTPGRVRLQRRGRDRRLRPGAGRTWAGPDVPAARALPGPDGARAPRARPPGPRRRRRGSGGTCSTPARSCRRRATRTSGSTGCWSCCGSRGWPRRRWRRCRSGIVRLVEVGRALASDPHVLLLDEPLSGLDMKASENLLAVFRQIVDADRASALAGHRRARRGGGPLPLGHRSSSSTSGSASPPARPEEIRNDPAVRSAYLGDSEPVGRTSGPRPRSDRDAPGEAT